jgi:RNA polymerase sigma-B factor
MKPLTPQAQEIFDLLVEYNQLKQVVSDDRHPADQLTLKKQNHQLTRKKQKIAELNSGLVRKEAKRWMQQCSEPFEDLYQEGSLGLFRAIDKFDPKMGNAFSSFACPYIDGAIKHYLRDRGWGLMRPPRRVLEEYARVVRCQRELQKTGIAVELDAVAIGLGFAEEKWSQMKVMRSRKPLVSLDDQSNNDERPIEIAEQDHYTESLEDENLKEWLFSELEKMPELQRVAICESVFAEQKAEAIARRHKTSPAIISILIQQGLEKLRTGHLEG